MKSFPVRNQLITWEIDDKGEASLVVPQKDKLWIRLTSKLFMLPDKRVIVLDSIGTYVWKMCDGKHTISQIIKGVQNQYQLTRKEAETSLFTFMQQLGKRNFIGFAIPQQQNAPATPESEPVKPGLTTLTKNSSTDNFAKARVLGQNRRPLRREK